MKGVLKPKQTMIETIKIGIFGGGGTGKTALTLIYVKGEFTEGYVPTIEDSFSKQILIEGRTINLELIRTKGQDDFKEMRFRYYQSSDCFVIVYSVIDKSSLESAIEIYHDICSSRGSEHEICIFAGNKADLKSEDSITLSEAQKVANELHCSVMEVSAKTAYNVSELFETLVKEYLGLGTTSKQQNNNGCCQIL